MSVLVKGIDKPTECFNCLFKGVMVDPFILCVIDGCPLVEVTDAEVEMLEVWECDRNICMSNEYNGIECDECEVLKHNEAIRTCDTCWVAQNYNLEDDDSPCLNCEAEPKHARWERKGLHLLCPLCGWRADPVATPFCPGCGADMRGDSER